MVSSRRSRASARPRSTIRLPYSVRLTMPLTISPTRSLYSSYCFLRSTSRTRCTITCLAVCAAMRPKSIGGSGSTMNSPAWMPGLNFWAMRSGICVASFSTGSCSTTSVQRERRTSPDLRSMTARMSFSCPYLARPAFWMACSMASSTSSRSIIFSRATASATCSSSGRAMATSTAMAWFSLVGFPAGFTLRALGARGPGGVVFGGVLGIGVGGIRRLVLGRHAGQGGGRRDQRVGQHQLGTADVAARESRLPALVQLQPGFLGIGTQHDAAEALAAILRDHQLERCHMTGEAVPVLGAGQRPVDAGGGNLQRPLRLDRVRDVEHGAGGMAHRLAILHAEGRAVGAVGHDLDDRPFLAGN